MTSGTLAFRKNGGKLASWKVEKKSSPGDEEAGNAEVLKLIKIASFDTSSELQKNNWKTKHAHLAEPFVVP